MISNDMIMKINGLWNQHLKFDIWGSSEERVGNDEIFYSDLTGMNLSPFSIRVNFSAEIYNNKFFTLRYSAV